MNVFGRITTVFLLLGAILLPHSAEAFFLAERPFDEPESTTRMLRDLRLLWDSGDLAAIERMAAEGDQASCYALATLTLMNLGTPRPTAEALADLNRLSRAGLVEATFLLAQTYASQEVLERDYSRALSYYQSASKADYLPAIESEGALLLFGAVDTGKHDQQARGESMLWEAVSRGSTGAMYNLSLHLGSSKATGAGQARADDLMRSAALGGHPRAQVHWAKRLIEVEGDESSSLRELLNLFEIADKQNSKVARDSLWALLTDLPASYGPVQVQLSKLLESACNSGRSTSCTYLGTKIVLGRLKNFEPRSGLDFLKAGYQRGDRGGSYDLGMIFLEGKLAKRDAALAATYLAEATRRGSLRAMYNLALMNIRGDGVDKDPEKACLLLARAVELGHKLAPSARDRQCPREMKRSGVAK